MSNDPGFSAQQFNSKKDHTEYEHKKTNAVDPVHVPNPFCFRLVAFSQIEILCDLSPHTHSETKVNRFLSGRF